MVWALTQFPEGHTQLLPVLRSWLLEAKGDIERQCAVSLAHVLVALQCQGHSPDPNDLAACRRVLERDAATHLGIRVQLCWLDESLEA